MASYNLMSLMRVDHTMSRDNVSQHKYGSNNKRTSSMSHWSDHFKIEQTLAQFELKYSYKPFWDRSYKTFYT